MRKEQPIRDTLKAGFISRLEEWGREGLVFLYIDYISYLLWYF